MDSRFSLDRIAYYLTVAAVMAMLFSIAVSQILLALALAALLMSGEKMRYPPFLIPLGIFFAGTVVSMLLSGDPSSGRPQLRKFLLFLIPLAVMSTVRTLTCIRTVLLLSIGVMTLSAIWSLVQFANKVSMAEALGRPFYAYYTSERITGFMSHWMTIGGQEMLIVLLAAALAIWSPLGKWKPWLLAAMAVILTSLILGFTRSIWLGTFCGGVYLCWVWKRWWVLALPVPILLMLAVNPFELRERARSAFQPHGDTDSNQFRYVCRRTGIEMIKAHPWFGLGPEQVRIQFQKWIPPDIPRPLPSGWYGHLHNIYIHFAAERGIPTMLALMWLLGKILYDFYSGACARTRDDEVGGILFGGTAIMIGMLAVGFYEVNLGDSEVLMLFLAVVSCGYSALALVLNPPSVADGNENSLNSPAHSGFRGDLTSRLNLL
jgi:O-antigen ligase